MAQTSALIKVLKSNLKSHGITYAQVAKELKLSEASIKRMFAEQSFSLERMDRICQMMGLEISDIVKQMTDNERYLEGLTHAQEYEITQDLTMVLVTVCVFNHWTLPQITQFFTLKEEECVKRLIKLDKLHVIKLLPNNRIKLLVSPNFKWIENGPFERFFRDHVGQEFFDSKFEGDHQCLIVLNGTFSRQSAEEFQRKLRRLVNEFSQLNQEDATLPFEQREGVTLVMAMRNWDYGIFHHLIRPEALAALNK